MATDTGISGELISNRLVDSSTQREMHATVSCEFSSSSCADQASVDAVGIGDQ